MPSLHQKDAKSKSSFGDGFGQLSAFFFFIHSQTKINQCQLLEENKRLTSVHPSRCPSCEIHFPRASPHLSYYWNKTRFSHDRNTGAVIRKNAAVLIRSTPKHGHSRFVTAAVSVKFTLSPGVKAVTATHTATPAPAASPAATASPHGPITNGSEWTDSTRVNGLDQLIKRINFCLFPITIQIWWIAC